MILRLQHSMDEFIFFMRTKMQVDKSKYFYSDAPKHLIKIINCSPAHCTVLAQFMNDNETDVMLLAETHLTNKYNFQIRGYMFYNTNHPEGKAHEGTGILIKNRIKHHFYNTFATNYL